MAGRNDGSAPRQGAFHLYWRLVAISIRAQAQYPGSLLLLSAGHLVVTLLEFLGVWALFDRFRLVRGWSLAEVALFYGLVNLSFALAEAVGRGFDAFDRLVRTGEFDVVLLRPRSEVLLICGQELRLSRAGRFAQGLIILGWGMSSLGLAGRPEVWMRLAWAVAGGTALFCGLFVLQATIAFWTVNSLEVVNTVTYGGVETAQFPIDIYPSAVRAFFTWVVPLASLNYLPLRGLLRGGDPGWVGWAAPLAGFLFLAVSLRLWRFGVRHYTSTGS
ncbi:MAG: ABC transporter permease [Candidatus Riflebacteria bacterium]|nr:ABC transporter permease [Candidatus Riflebacteria bacterium]